MCEQVRFDDGRVARALGKRIRDLPLTRERIVATLLAE
jgi:CO/xanthine dehydrogenase Mo-binding subunit